MAKSPQPLGQEFPIVGPDGKPTMYFIRWAQQRQLDIQEGITAVEAQALIDNWAADRDIIAGDGLSGGGPLSSDVTIDLDAGLADLNDVDFTTAPAATNVLTFNGLKWVPAAGGGGPITAASVINVPNGNISATNVQAAIDELDSEKVAKAGDTMTGNLIMNPGVIKIGTGTIPANTYLYMERIGGGQITSRIVGEGSVAVFKTRHSTDISGSQDIAQKARGTVASPTVVVSGDATGQWLGRGYDGVSAFRDAGRIDISIIQPTPGPTAMGGQITFNPTPLGSITPTASLTLTSALTSILTPTVISGGILSVTGGNIAVTRAGAGGVITLETEGQASLQSMRYTNDGTAADFQVRKARGTIAVPAAVQGNDQIGNYSYVGYDGTAFRTAVQLQVRSIETTPGSAAFGSRLLLNVVPVGSGAVSELARWDHSTGFSMFGANTVVDQNRIFTPRSYTIGTLPTITTTGLIHASDLGGSPGPMASDGTQWRRLLPGGVTNATNADFTLTVRTDADNILHTGTLTAIRTVTLSTTGVRPGDEFLITRTGGGAFALNVGTGPLVALTTGTWATVKVNAAGAWYLAACGPLSVSGGGGGGSGALTLILETTTSGTAANVNFSSISSAYRDLEIRVRGRGTAASGGVPIQIRFNSDTGANYDAELVHAFDTGTNFTSQMGQTSGVLGQIAAATAPAGRAGMLDIAIGDYRGTTFNKQCITTWGATIGTGAFGIGTGLYTTNWRSTAAISAIDVFPNSGAFVDGTVVSLYGRM